MILNLARRIPAILGNPFAILESYAGRSATSFRYCHSWILESRHLDLLPFDPVDLFPSQIPTFCIHSSTRVARREEEIIKLLRKEDVEEIIARNNFQILLYITIFI